MNQSYIEVNNTHSSASGQKLVNPGLSCQSLLAWTTSVADRKK